MSFAETCIVILTYVYVIASTLMNLMLLYCLFFSKEKLKFTSAFYILYKIQSIASFVFTLTNELHTKLPLAPFGDFILTKLPSNGFFPTVILVISYHSGIILFLIEGFMSFNRATTIMMGLRYKRFWKIAIPWVHVIVLILPVVITWPLWLQNVTIDFANPDYPEFGYNWSPRNLTVLPYLSAAVTTFALIGLIAIWSLIWNVYTLVFIVKRNLIPGNPALTKTSNLELRFFLFSFVIFIMQFATSLFSVFAIFKYMKSRDSTLMIYLYMLLDSCHYGPPWILYITQKEVRTAVGKCFGRSAGCHSTSATRNIVCKLNNNGIIITPDESDLPVLFLKTVMKAPPQKPDVAEKIARKYFPNFQPDPSALMEINNLKGAFAQLLVTRAQELTLLRGANSINVKDLQDALSMIAPTELGTCLRRDGDRAVTEYREKQKKKA